MTPDLSTHVVNIPNRQMIKSNSDEKSHPAKLFLGNKNAGALSIFLRQFESAFDYSELQSVIDKLGYPVCM